MRKEDIGSNWIATMPRNCAFLWWLSDCLSLGTRDWRLCKATVGPIMLFTDISLYISNNRTFVVSEPGNSAQLCTRIYMPFIFLPWIGKWCMKWRRRKRLKSWEKLSSRKFFATFILFNLPLICQFISFWILLRGIIFHRKFVVPVRTILSNEVNLIKSWPTILNLHFAKC